MNRGKEPGSERGLGLNNSSKFSSSHRLEVDVFLLEQSIPCLNDAINSARLTWLGVYLSL